MIDHSNIQDILGHATPDITTKFYTKGIAARQKSAAEEMDNRLSKKVVSIRKRESA